MSERERINRVVVIANRSYPLKIYKSDEDRILALVDEINKKIDKLKTQYDAKDNQDYLAMCLLQYFSQNINNSEKESTSDSNVSGDIFELIENIEQQLNSISLN